MSVPDREGAAAAPAARAGGTWPLLRVLLLVGYGLAILAGAMLPLAGMRWIGLTAFFAVTQDLSVAAAMALACLGVAVAVWRSPVLRLRLPAGRAVLWAGAAGAFGIAAVGALVFDGSFGLSHDELILLEEARQFLSGRLAAPVPAEWQPFLHQMFPYYVRASADGALLSSAYYPGSAAIWALFAALGAGPLANPLLAGGAVLLTAALARRIFPGRDDLALLAALLLAGSPQFLVTAMTPFAMTDHLFLNLAWLVLFLRDTRRAHAATMVVGVIAIAQHQLHIHPLFALPFLADLVLRRRRWALGLAYAAVYAGVLAGCLGWRSFVLDGPALNLMHGSVEASGLGAILARLLAPGAGSGLATVLTLDLWNLLRFVLWQNPLTVVLVVLGLAAIRHAPRELGLLAIGIPLAVLPNLLTGIHDQGIGWGYRYLHVHLASLSLLAALGADRLRAGAPDAPAWLRMRGGLALLGLAVGPALLVWRIADFGGMILPYRAADAAIRGMQSDVVLSAHDALVRNDFGFEGRPKLMAYRLMDPDGLAVLCRRGSVVVLSPDFMASFGIGAWDPRMEPSVAERYYRDAQAQLAAAGCR